MTDEERQRITHVCADIPEEGLDGPDRGHPIPWTQLALLLSRLPGLQSLRLTGALPEDSLEQRMVYDALVALPQLAELGMPYGNGVENLHRLAGRLRRLRIFDDYGPQLDEPTIGAISQLHQLQELAFGSPFEDFGIVVELLRRVPDSLELLTLLFDFKLQYMVRLRLRGGTITSVEVSRSGYGHRDVSLSCLADLAARVLLPSGAVGRRLERLAVDTLSLCNIGESDAPNAGDLIANACPELRVLLQRCEAVEVGTAVLSEPLPPAAVLGTLAQLRGVRALELEVHARYSWPCPCIRVRLATPAAVHAQPPAHPTAAGASPVAVVATPLQAAAAASAAHTAEGGPLTAPPSLEELVVERALLAPLPAGAPLPDDGPHLVLLRGPLLAGLAWAPDALRAWLRQLAGKAAAQAGGGEGPAVGAAVAGSGGESRPSAEVFKEYLPLPRSSAVLLLCGTAAAAEALAAAAGAAAAEMGRVAGAGNPASRLLAARVELEVPARWRGRQSWWTSMKLLKDLFVNTAIKFAESAWARGALDGIGGQQQRLRWLLEQHESLCSMEGELVQS